MTNKVSEKQLYPQIEKFLVRRGFKTCQEVKPNNNSSRRVDVVGVKPRLKDVVAVEAKLSDYKRVMRQAMVGLFISDFVYISLPFGYANTVLTKHEDELKELGIGVLGVNGKALEMLSPSRSAYVDPSRKQKLIDTVINRRNNNE